jgi:DnaJ-class molecular chaperone/tetratricopeptide (TPR) repeat protein
MPSYLLGIDFGTSSVRVQRSVLDDQGKLHADPQAAPLHGALHGALPAVLEVDPESKQIVSHGLAAQNRLLAGAGRGTFIEEFKPCLGRAEEDLAAQGRPVVAHVRFCPRCRTACTPSANFCNRCGGTVPSIGDATPEVLFRYTQEEAFHWAERLMERIVRDLAQRYGEGLNAPNRWTIVAGVPVHWGPATRERYRQLVCRCFGNEQVRIVPEPEAALACHLHRDALRPVTDGRWVLVVDFGGGTTDLVLVRPAPDGRTLQEARAYGERYGGGDFDVVVAGYIAGQLKIPLEGALPPALKQRGKELKEQLSHALAAGLNECILHQAVPVGTQVFRGFVRLDRDTFQSPQVAGGLVEEFERLLHRGLGHFRVGPDEVGAVIMTGGGASWYFVDATLRRLFPHCPVIAGEEPSLAIAKGLALPPPPAPGQDLRLTLELTAGEARRGGPRILTIGTRREPIPVPPDAVDGQELCLKGRGEPGQSSGPPGDLYVKLRVVPDPVAGTDVHATASAPTLAPDPADDLLDSLLAAPGSEHEQDLRAEAAPPGVEAKAGGAPVRAAGGSLLAARDEGKPPPASGERKEGANGGTAVERPAGARQEKPPPSGPRQVALLPQDMDDMLLGHLRGSLEVTPTEAERGARLTVLVEERRQQVEIPRGAQDGQVVTVTGAGHPAQSMEEEEWGAEPVNGDLLLTLRLAAASAPVADLRLPAQPTPGADLRARLELTAEELAGGVTKPVSVNGRTVNVTVPAGCREQELKVPGAGEPGTNGGPAGNLLVRLEVLPPVAPPPGDSRAPGPQEVVAPAGSGTAVAPPVPPEPADDLLDALLATPDTEEEQHLPAATVPPPVEARDDRPPARAGGSEAPATRVEERSPPIPDKPPVERRDGANGGTAVERPAATVPDKPPSGPRQVTLLPQDMDDMLLGHLRGSLEVTPTEAERGARLTVLVDERREQVEIPRGAQDGQVVTVTGAGHPAQSMEADEWGGEAANGDLFLTLRLPAQPAPGKDVRVPLALTFEEARDGGSKTVPVGQRTEIVEIGAGAQDGREIVLEGRGEPGQAGGPAGNLIVTLQVAPPPAISPDPGTGQEPASGGAATPVVETAAGPAAAEAHADAAWDDPFASMLDTEEAPVDVPEATVPEATVPEAAVLEAAMPQTVVEHPPDVHGEDTQPVPVQAEAPGGIPPGGESPPGEGAVADPGAPVEAQPEQATPQPAPSKDLEGELLLAPAETKREVTKFLTIQGRQVSVKVPPGVQAGQALPVWVNGVECMGEVSAGAEGGLAVRVPGQGEPGRDGEAAGDLVVRLQVCGSDQETTLALTAEEARGGVTKPATVDGREVPVTVPPNAAHGQTLLVKGGGEPGSGGGPAGDLTVRLVVGGGDLQADVTLTDEEAEQGCTKSVQVGTREETIEFPAGRSDGEVYRVVGGGEPGGLDAPPGDLLVNVSVKAQPRQGKDIHADLVLTQQEIRKGLTRPVPVDGRQVSVKVPPRSGPELRVPGEGEPGRSGGPAGDLIVRLKVRGKDLQTTLKLTAEEVEQGVSKPVTVNGRTVSVTVPAGLKERKVTVPEGGEPGLHGGPAGDLLVRLKVGRPKRVARKRPEEQPSPVPPDGGQEPLTAKGAQPGLPGTLGESALSAGDKPILVRLRRPLTIGAILAAAAGLVALIMWVVHYQSLLPVPNVKGKTLGAARRAIQAAGLVVGRVTPEPSEAAMKGKLLRTQPAAGARIAKRSRVDLFMGDGSVVSNVGNGGGKTNQKKLEERARQAYQQILENKTQEAVRIAQEVVAQSDKIALAYAVLGYVYITEGRWNEAKVEVPKALALNGRHPLALACSGRIQAEEAIIRKDPERRAMFQKAAGQCETAVGRESTSPLAREALAAVYHLGTVHRIWQRDGQAKEQYQRVKSLAPRWASGYIGLGLLYYDQGADKQAPNTSQAQALRLYRDAAREWEQATRVAPDSALGHSNLAQVYHLLGQYNNALAHCSRLIELEPENKDAQAMLSFLRGKTSQSSAGSVECRGCGRSWALP